MIALNQRLKIEQNLILRRKLFAKIVQFSFEELKEYLSETLGSAFVKLDAEMEETHLPRSELVSDSDGSLSREIISCLPLARLDDTTESVAEFLAFNLDNNGHLLVTVEEVEQRFNVEREVVYKAIQALKDIGPEGVLLGTVTGFGDSAAYVQPDIVIDVKNDEFVVEVKEIDIAHYLSWKPAQRGMLAFLCDAVEKRQRLLKLLGWKIVEFNTDFLLNLMKYPRRVKMKSIAKETNLSISTVSRAVCGKYAATPRGIYSLKSFFGRGYERSLLLEAVASILKEHPNWTDLRIASELSKEGICVARRTVNKYRRIVERVRKSEKSGTVLER